MAGTSPINDSDPHDDHGHGTHVSGTVAAIADNGLGISGVARAQILAIRVLSAGGSGTFSWISQCIVYAADNGAHIINMSLGCTWCSLPTELKDAIDYAASRGVLIVAAAGNSNTTAASYPSDYAPALGRETARHAGADPAAAAWSTATSTTSSRSGSVSL